MNSHASRPGGVRLLERGIVLLEVLVAILIFSFGILGTVGLLARATQFSTNAEDRNRAALLANEVASSMWAARTVNVNTAAWQTRVADQAGAGLPSGAGTVVVDAATGVATITVTWRPTFARAGEPNNQYVTQVVVP